MTFEWLGSSGSRTNDKDDMKISIGDVSMWCGLLCLIPWSKFVVISDCDESGYDLTADCSTSK